MCGGDRYSLVVGEGVIRVSLVIEVIRLVALIDFTMLLLF